MRWLIYDTQEQALAVESYISLQMGLPRVGTNAATGELDLGAVTERWAVPRQITDGRWVIPSPDEGGEEERPGWWPEQVVP